MGVKKIDYAAHYNFDDYQRWSDPWELIDGVPYAMSPAPSLLHQRINGRIISHLRELLANCAHCEALMPVDWKVSDDTVVQPDASVLCEPASGNYITTAPVLIFEIFSPSTKSKDQHLKFELYQREGVKYYVMIDPIEEKALIYHLDDGTYQLLLKTKESVVNFDLDKCQIDFNCEKLWKN